MEIKKLEPKSNLEQHKKLFQKYTRFERLLDDLRKKEIPDQVVELINQGIMQVNAVPEIGKEYSTQLKKTQAAILGLLEKEMGWVAKNHYRNQWLALGMTVFGLPFGVVFGMSLGNMGYLGIGLPIGMAIGIAVGSGKDKEAKEQGKQLDIEL